MCLSVCRFVLVFFGPFGVAVASLGERAKGWGEGGGGWSWCFSCVCSVCACLGLSVSSWGLGVGAAFVIVALPGLFSYLFFVPQGSTSVSYT